MKGNKTSTNASTSIKPISLVSGGNYPSMAVDKVEKLNTLVYELHEESSMVGPHTGSNSLSERVLQEIKSRIKTNYEQMYNKYDDNKHKILQHITVVEGSLNKEEVKMKRLNCLVKEKQKHDKVNGEVQQRRKELAKLQQMCRQLKPSQVAEYTTEDTLNIEELFAKEVALDYRNDIFKGMLACRKTIRAQLKQRNGNLDEWVTMRKEKIEKLSLNNTIKQGLLNQLQQFLIKEEIVEVPPDLAAELASKMQLYENRLAYANIVELENKRAEELEANSRIEQAREQKQSRQLRAKLEAQCNAERDKESAQFALKQYEQQKIKRLCGVDDISKISDGQLVYDQVRLTETQAGIQQEIVKEQIEKKELTEEIERLLNMESTATEANIYSLEQQQDAINKQLKRLQNYVVARKNISNQWDIIIHMLQGNKKQ